MSTSSDHSSGAALGPYEIAQRGVSPASVKTMSSESELSRWMGGHWRFVVAGLLVVHSGLVLWNGEIHSPSWDEAGHLVAGIHHWEQGEFEYYKVNPPLVRMVAALPAVTLGHEPLVRIDDAYFAQRPEWRTGMQFLRDHGPQSFRYFSLGRWACLPFSLAAGAAICCWARELYGTTAGVVAAGVWCFEPNVLGNAGLITPDLGAAATGVLAAYSFRRWLLRPTWTRVAWAALALGMAELTKMTWIIFFGLWPLLWGLWQVGQRSNNAKSRLLGGLQLAVILIGAVYVINAGYGFENSCRRLREFQFFSAPLRGSGESTVQGLPAGNRFQQTWLGAIPVPLPANYVLGIDFQRREFDAGYWSYLLGELRQQGWWYYYLLALLWKVPLGIWMLIVLATLAAWRFRNTVAFREQLLLTIIPIVLIALVSSQTGFNHHLRYVLPAFPFLFVWAGQAARFLDVGYGFFSACTVIGLAWAISSSLCIYPHSLSYFNELVGGPGRACDYMGCSPMDSNLECGQDVLLLREWLDRHPSVKLSGISYGGMQQMHEAAGITCGWPPVGAAPDDLQEMADGNDAPGPQSGWYAVSVKNVHARADGPRFTYFSRFRPVARIGFSMMIYHISEKEAAGYHRSHSISVTAQ